MISRSVVVPFQKGPCGDGGREMRGFLLPLLEEASVVVLVLLLIFEFFSNIPYSHNTKVNRINFSMEIKEERKLLLWMDQWRSEVSGREAERMDGIIICMF